MACRLLGFSCSSARLHTIMMPSGGGNSSDARTETPALASHDHLISQEDTSESLLVPSVVVQSIEDDADQPLISFDSPPSSPPSTSIDSDAIKMLDYENESTLGKPVHPSGVSDVAYEVAATKFTQTNENAENLEATQASSVPLLDLSNTSSPPTVSLLFKPPCEIPLFIHFNRTFNLFNLFPVIMIARSCSCPFRLEKMEKKKNGRQTFTECYRTHPRFIMTV